MPNMDSFIFYTNEEKSVTPFYHKVAAWVHDMFFNFCLVKNIWLTNKWTTTETREKIASTCSESLKF